jgi:CRP-like cAMP-binding protein
VRQLVKGATELQALEAGEIDAVMDPASLSAILLPEAQAALRGAIRRASRRSGRTKPSRMAAAARAGAPNSLLAGLPAAEYERLLACLEPVTLSCGEVLCEPGQQTRYVYFPSDCVVSMLTVIDGHRTLAVGMIGREGIVGARLGLGIGTSSVRALVQGSGAALRMSPKRFVRELRRSPALQGALFRFTDALMIQISQTAACNRFHMVQSRLIRWLLMTRERVPSGVFHLTQEFLADLLGVRRVGVTAAASALQRRQLIRYRRGTITILDQQGLEVACCSCYRDVQRLACEAAK